MPRCTTPRSRKRKWPAPKLAGHLVKRGVVASCNVSGREARERLAYITIPQPLERAVPQLAHPLARHAEHAADLLERVLAAAIQPEIQAEHLGVAPLERADGLLELVRQEAVHRLVFRVGEVFGDKALDQRPVAVRIERGIEPHVARVERREGLHYFER